MNCDYRGLPKDHRHLLQFQMKIPQPSKMQEMQQMLEMVMNFVDIVEKAGKLSREVSSCSNSLIAILYHS